METSNWIHEYIGGFTKQKLPDDLTRDQFLLLMMARDLHIIRSSIGIVAFLAIVTVVLSIIGMVFG